jgi:hypothetical protein
MRNVGGEWHAEEETQTCTWRIIFISTMAVGSPSPSALGSVERYTAALSLVKSPILGAQRVFLGREVRWDIELKKGTMGHGVEK